MLRLRLLAGILVAAIERAERGAGAGNADVASPAPHAESVKLGIVFSVLFNRRETCRLSGTMATAK